jgi:Zn-dependent peptidase ImmA (M78 family)
VSTSEDKADNRRAGALARKLRKSLELTHPTDLALEIVAHQCGLLTRTVELRGAQAMLIRVGKRGEILVQKGLPRRERRFAIAHEIGHAHLHREVSHLGRCTGEVESRHRVTKEEAEADAFATELLLPRASVLPKVTGQKTRPATWDSIKSLAHDYDVSLTAAALRYLTLTDKTIALVCAKGGVIQWARRSFRWKTPLARHTQVPSSSAMHSAQAEWQSIPSETPAQTWSPSLEGRIQEHVFTMPARGLTMGLLSLQR